MSADHIAEVLRLRQVQAARDAGGPRKLVEEFPEVFEGLLPYEVYRVALRARELARGRVWDIEEHHLNQARFEHDQGRVIDE